jgi:hypothetical protein
LFHFHDINPKIVHARCHRVENRLIIPELSRQDPV